MKLNTQNLFNFLLLVSFVYGVSVDSGYNMKQRKIATKTKLRNNWDETPGTAITPQITISKEKKIESELNNLTQHKFKTGKILRTHLNGIARRNNFYRKIRNVMNREALTDNLECFTCFGSGVTKKDKDCYRGIGISTEKCIYGQQCYVELREDFIKRGCISRNRMNRTFVCKCPLCNDKPADNPIYYNYDKISDWAFYNKYLQKPSDGSDLICKICETRGTNAISDSTCRFGKYADYMVCGVNQVCYTNIDDGTNFVSRGCINKPITNSFLRFCNNSLCNFNTYDNPQTTKIGDLHLRAPLAKVLISKACNKNVCWKFILLAYTIVQIRLKLNFLEPNC